MKIANDRQKRVIELCDGIRSSRVIAESLGERVKYVQKTMVQFDLPRRTRGSASGNENGSWLGGRRVDRDGYVLTSAPKDHPYARYVKNRPTGRIYEHRLVMEENLGRFLLPQEVVDHIDGLRLHNAPDNLRLFSSNSEHLKATITNQVPNWSKLGMANLDKSRRQQPILKPARNYEMMKKSGDARLIQILRAALQLGIDSPFLLGTSHHLQKVGIVDLSHSNLERELEALYRKYA